MNPPLSRDPPLPHKQISISRGLGKREERIIQEKRPVKRTPHTRYRAGAGSQAHNQETSTHNLPTIKHSHSTRFDVPRALRVPPPEETGNSSKEVYARIQWRKASSKRGAYGP